MTSLQPKNETFEGEVKFNPTHGGNNKEDIVDVPNAGLTVFNEILLGSEIPPPPKKRVLDLFSGTGSVSSYLLSKGYDVVSLDNSRFARRVGVFLQEDILSWDYTVYPPVIFS